MFSEELNRLIEASVIDGVISEKERAVLRKRALLEGVDPDEVEVMLDARVQEINDLRASERQPRHCPSCGALVPALSGICPNCGAVVAVESVNGGNKELMQLIGELEHALSQLKLGIGTKASVERLQMRASTLYGDDPKVRKLLGEVSAQMERVQAKRRSTVRLTAAAVSLVASCLLALGIWAMISSSQRNKVEQQQKKELLEQVKQQRSELCAKIDALDEPNDDNYRAMTKKLLNITWQDLSGATLNGGNDFEKSLFSLERQEKSRFLDKKRAYAKQLKAIYDRKGDTSAPDEIRVPSLYMKY